MQITIENENFLIRINGPLWPPYTRQIETEVLEILNKSGVEHNVLVNSEGFQICRPFPEDKQLSRILQTNTPERIANSLELAACEMANYHALLLDDFPVIYPLENMVNDAKRGLERKFQNFKTDSEDAEYIQTLKALQFLTKQCVKIPAVLDRCILIKTFSQNDTIASSIYIDNDNEKATIVDWEYAAWGYWSNDLALLSVDLRTEQEKNILADAYHQARTDQNMPMPDEQKFLLEINTLVHNFLKIGWRITPDTLLENKLAITELKEQLERVLPKIQRFSLQQTNFFEQLKPLVVEQIYIPNREEKVPQSSISLRNNSDG
jgi:thiamine kinase-like enzyme